MNWDYVPVSDDLKNLAWIGTSVRRARFQSYKLTLENDPMEHAILTVFNDSGYTRRYPTDNLEKEIESCLTELTR